MCTQLADRQSSCPTSRHGARSTANFALCWVESVFLTWHMAKIDTAQYSVHGTNTRYENVSSTPFTVIVPEPTSMLAAARSLDQDRPREALSSVTRPPVRRLPDPCSSRATPRISRGPGKPLYRDLYNRRHFVTLDRGGKEQVATIILI